MKKICSLLVAATGLCCGESLLSKLSPDLSTVVPATSSGLVRVIIQWNSDGSSPSQKIIALGGTILSEYEQTHSGTYLVLPSAFDTLAKDSAVRYIAADRAVRRKLANTAAAIGAPAVWKAGYTGTGIGVAVIDSGINADGNLGGGIVNGLLGAQSGVAYSEDFTGKFSNANPNLFSLLLGGKNTSNAPDWYGHGHHIAGIIASNGASSNCPQCTATFLGMAPGVSLINLKVLDAQGEGNESDVIAAINRAIALKSKYKIRVINLSLGGPIVESYKDDPLCQAVESAWKAGIVVVVAAGNEGRDNSFSNEGYGTITAPGNDPYVITVGSMKTMGTPVTSDDRIASYSSKGPSMIDHVVKPDLVAPGNQVVSLRAHNSTLPLLVPANIPPLSSYQPFYGPTSSVTQPAPPSDPSVQPSDARIGWGYSPNYFVLSGTSMAAAAVSGAVADLLQAAPGLTPDQIKMLLMKTASKSFPDESSIFDSSSGITYTSYYDIFTIGAGYVNVKAALAQVNQIPAGVTALSPTATYHAESGEVNLVFDPSSVFSEKAMWGANSIAGNKAMWGASAVWSDSVLVGNKAMWGASAIWGTSSGVSSEKAMWGASGLWGEKAMWGASAGSHSESIVMSGEN